MKKKRVLAFGTFDLLHAGHLHYLQQAKRLGKELVVVVARDATVKKVKGCIPVHSEKHRLELIAALEPVGKAVLGCAHSKMFDCVAALKPVVIAMGYDQAPDSKTLKEELAKLGCFPKIVRLKSFNARSNKTSRIKERIRKGGYNSRRKVLGN